LTPANHGHAAWVFTSTFGGGLVGGDAIRLEARVDEGATLVLLTQASTKVYRADRETSTALTASVEGHGTLIVLPDPVVAFAGASYSQRQHVRLAAAATLVFVDWFTAGRQASGERWAFSRYASRLAIERAGRRILTDALRLDVADGEIGRRMGRFNAVCTIVLSGGAAGAASATLRERIGAEPVGSVAPVITSAAPLGDDGGVFRIAGVSVEAVAARVRDFLSFLPALLGDDPWSRKW
jgi:urease accessory protein